MAAGAGGMGGAMALYLGFRHAAFSVAAPLSAVATAGVLGAGGPAVRRAPRRPGPGRDRPGPARHRRRLGQPAVPGTAEAPAASEGSASGAAADGDGGGGREGGSGRQLAGGLYGLAAGAGFGVLFIGLNRASSGSDLWPAVIAQLAGLAFVSVLGVARGQLRLPRGRASWLAVLTGVTGAGGTLCYFVATHAGLLAVTAVITSLYPASTILLARLVLGERITKIRIAGLGLAAASVALIAFAGTG